jgi:hypothetical protein
MVEGKELGTIEVADRAIPEAGSLLSVLYRVAAGPLVRYAITSQDPALRQGSQLEG